MKSGIHPDYREAVFVDTSTGHKFLTRTTMVSKETVKWEDGKDYSGDYRFTRVYIRQRDRWFTVALQVTRVAPQ